MKKNIKLFILCFLLLIFSIFTVYASYININNTYDTGFINRNYTIINISTNDNNGLLNIYNSSSLLQSNKIIGNTFYNSSNYTYYEQSYCYQEQANISSSCGGLNTGTYDAYPDSNTASFGVFSNVYDGNYSTGYRIFLSFSFHYHSELYINYSKPVNSLTKPLWQFKIETNFSNVTIPDVCYNTFNDKISLLVSQNNFEQSNPSITRTAFSCFNGTNYITIYEVVRDTISYPPVIYEEAIFWNINKSNSSNLFLKDGLYYYNVSVLQNNSNTYNFTVDTIYPTITVNNNSLSVNFINVSSNDVNFNGFNIRIYDSFNNKIIDIPVSNNTYTKTITAIQNYAGITFHLCDTFANCENYKLNSYKLNSPYYFNVLSCDLASNCLITQNYTLNININNENDKYNNLINLISNIFLPIVFILSIIGVITNNKIFFMTSAVLFILLLLILLGSLL